MIYPFPYLQIIKTGKRNENTFGEWGKIKPTWQNKAYENKCVLIELSYVDTKKDTKKIQKKKKEWQYFRIYHFSIDTTHTGIDLKPSGFWRVLTALVRNSSIQFFFRFQYFLQVMGFRCCFSFDFNIFCIFFYAQLLYSMCVFFSSVICSVHVCTCGSSTSGIRSSIRFKSMFCVLLFSGATIYQAFTLSK